VKAGELNYRVAWSNHRRVNYVLVTDMAPDDSVETARR